MSGAALEHEEFTRRIIGCAIEVHRHLGPGLLESIYELCLEQELRSCGMACERQVELPIVYKEHTLDGGLRMDLVVERAVVLEVKATQDLHPIHEAQLLTYLKLSGFPVGLLMNFNTEVLRNGIKRRANTIGPRIQTITSPLRASASLR